MFHRLWLYFPPKWEKLHVLFAALLATFLVVYVPIVLEFGGACVPFFCVFRANDYLKCARTCRIDPLEERSDEVTLTYLSISEEDVIGMEVEENSNA